MWKAYMKCDITLGIGVCPATIKIIAIPLAMSSQRFLSILTHYQSKVFSLADMPALLL